ncbi:Flp family type IVb pilin [Novosphingobium sp. FSW06-99]|uniref:Flp family type IVb pilin n=1 Tax=Novosphingobium sp. FSW06-99 TaxID=1739113 RepID=UPI001E4F139B|nr:hypothetical protein [Novosphingobium sp. FSW06-99]
MKLLRALMADRQAATAVEYGLLAAPVSVAALTAIGRCPVEHVCRGGQRYEQRVGRIAVTRRGSGADPQEPFFAHRPQRLR